MPDPAPVSVDTPNVLDLQFIVVTVRTDFRFEKFDGSVTFHWITGGAGAGGTAASPGNGETIAGATVELLERNSGTVRDSATTDRNGQAALETSQLPDGTYIIKITPKNSRNELAGPGIAETDPAPLPDRMYHPLEVTVKLSHGSIETAVLDPDIAYAGLGNRIQPKWPPDTMPTDHLPIDLKPIWMRKPLAAPVRANEKIQMAVVHNTGGKIVTGTINKFISPVVDGAHYVIDLNGHIIKFVKDHEIAAHAGGKWKGRDPNPVSIGIEIVHDDSRDEYTRQQYAALMDLLDRLIAAYPIDRTQITSHSDVGTRISVVAASLGKPIDLDLLEGDRDSDPGQEFQWERLEEHGLGMIPQNVVLGDAYGGLFNGAEDVVLVSGDNDVKHRFGGKKRTDTPGTPIKDLQQDISDIGYSLHVNGVYDQYTEFGVRAFQRHFFSGSRLQTADGRVDRATAQMIKNVKGA